MVITQNLIDEWQDWQRAGGLSERTIKERCGTVRQLCVLADLPPDQISAKHIIRFLGRPEVGQVSRATYYSTLRTFFQWAVLTEELPLDPMLKVPKPRRPKSVPRPVKDGNLVKLIGAANRRRTRMMILLATLQGLRIHEVAKVAGEDFDFDDGTLTVVGKGNKQAFLPIHDLVREEARLFPSSGYWFPSYRDKTLPILPTAVGKAIGDAMRRAGFDGTPHQLRHWYGTNLLNDGATARTVQELLRHANLASTQIYTEVTTAQMREAISRLQLPAELAGAA